MTLAAALLVGGMLCVMAARVAGPFGQAASGAVLLQHQLGVRERLLLHRHSLYALGLVLLLGAVTGAIPRGIELTGILGALSIVFGIRATYRVTEHGIGLNTVVFRRWGELESVQETPRTLRLRAITGMADFTVICLPGDQRNALRRVIVDRLRRVGGAPRGTPATAAGTRHGPRMQAAMRSGLG